MYQQVLVVEDDGLQRRVLVQRLAALGVTDIHEAQDGVDALAVLDHHPNIELVISDLDMPRMDGLALLREVGQRAHAATFALHSAMDRELLTCMELIARERKIRFAGFLRKPASNEDIHALLERMVAQVTGTRPNRPAVVSRADLEAALRERQLEVYLQPKVHILSQRLVGAEALARWQHPVHGLLAPVAFLDAFDAAGLFEPMTLTLLEQAMAQLAAWGACAVPVANNLSLGFLSTPGISDVIARMCDRYGLAPSLVRFEITEHVAMTDVGTCLENIARLRLRGHQFSLDDFGVGYSSLQQLIRIPADEIKLDRSFISGLMPGSRAALAVAATIAMARQMQMTSVAEGIETEADLARVRDMGCDIAQGYLIARPMPAAELWTWAAASPHLSRATTLERASAPEPAR